MIINQTTLSREEAVFLRLEEDILSGVYKHGDTLTELAVCERLGVSRTPVRGALLRLSDEGLISLAPNRGATVIGVTMEDIVDIYKIRIRLEGLAARTATERLNDADRAELKKQLELSEFYVSKGDTDSLRELDTAFHGVIYRASSSRMLEKILSELHRKIRGYRKMSLSVPGRLERSIAEHREIYEAMISGDGELADSLTKQHVERAMNNLLCVRDG